MKILTVLLALLIKVSLYSQYIPINKRFNQEEYRLFIPGHSRMVVDSLYRTDQLYKIKLIEEEDIYIIQNNALKFVCDLRTGTAEVYFDGKLDSKYAIKQRLTHPMYEQLQQAYAAGVGFNSKSAS